MRGGVVPESSLVTVLDGWMDEPVFPLTVKLLVVGVAQPHKRWGLFTSPASCSPFALS